MKYIKKLNLIVLILFLFIALTACSNQNKECNNDKCLVKGFNDYEII